ncbi:hypothetical protein ACMFMG_002654 [Clarireedia jacksonii]
MSALSTIGEFGTFPWEIRQEIYKYLLINPILATEEALEENVVYGLGPAILRTCRQIYTEASEVLYSQVFISHCGRIKFKYRPPYPQTPFSRKVPHFNETVRWKIDPIFRILAMGKVRRWKVLLDGEIYSAGSISQLTDFCQAVCRAAPKRIDVYIRRYFLFAHNVLFQPSNFGTPSETLGPLSMLRNVGLLTVRNYFLEMDKCDLTGFLRNRHDWIYEAIEPGRALTRTLKTLAEGDRPVERTWEMNRLLQKLARAFERYVPHKLTMAGERLGQYTYYYFVADELKRLGHGEFCRTKSTNPYIQGHNLLENEMEMASTCANDLNSAGFKRHRKQIVEHLQRHYRRIVTAAETLNDYLPKINISFIDSLTTMHERKRCAAPLLILIEHYAASFDREQTLGTQVEFRLQKERFDLVYGSMRREVLLAKLRSMFENDNYAGFGTTVIEVMKDMDSQLREIKEAWENLFSLDVYDERCCDVDFGDCTVNFNKSEMMLNIDDIV